MRKCYPIAPVNFTIDDKSKELANVNDETESSESGCMSDTIDNSDTLLALW